MRAMKVSFLALLLFGALAAPSWAVSPFGYKEGFEADVDTFVPDANANGDWVDDGPFGPIGGTQGFLPGAQPGSPAPGDGSVAGQDWFDARTDVNASSGLIEEVPSGFEGVPSPYGLAHGFVGLKDSFSNPFGRIARQTANPNGFGGVYSATTDFYTDDSLPDNTGGLGTTNFWWTNAIQDATISNSYLDERGIVLDKVAGVHNFRTTAGNFLLAAAPNTWYRWETVAGNDGTNLIWTMNVWDIGQTTILATFSEATAAPVANIGGPRYNWFAQTHPAGTVQHLAVDNVGWGDPLVAVPEPSTFVLAGLGALGLLMVRRRRNAA